MRFLRSSALTLAVAYIGLGLTALALFAAPLWYAWRVTVQEGRNENLQADAQRLTEVFHRQGSVGLIGYINTRVGLQIGGDRLLLLVDANQQPLAGNLRQWPSAIPIRPGSYSGQTNLGRGEREVAVVNVALGDGEHLLVGRDTSRYLPLERRFWYALGSAVLILSVLGTLGGILIRRALMNRIHGLRQTVSAIVQGDLSHRLLTRQSGDELNTLAQTINGMLEQIEHLIRGVRDVSNSIAHDLRTPLAELRSRLEELSLTKPAPDQTFAEIDGAVADVDRVMRIFNALLRLAEIDSGLRRSGFVPIDVADIAAAAVEFYQPAAELRGSTVAFECTGPARTRGDPVLLAQALANLIDNALKYTPENGTITVSVRAVDDRQVELVVADHGPGIGDEEKPKVTQRFYRGDASRCSPGVGLGLSLVDAVARLHGASLRLEDNAPGLRARMVLVQDTIAVTQFTQTAKKEGELHEPVYS